MHTEIWTELIAIRYGKSNAFSGCTVHCITICTPFASTQEVVTFTAIVFSAQFTCLYSCCQIVLNVPACDTFLTIIVFHTCLTILNCTILSHKTCRMQLFSNAAILGWVPRNVTVSSNTPVLTPMIPYNPLCFSVSYNKHIMINDPVLWFTFQGSFWCGVGRRSIWCHIWSTNTCNDRFLENDFFDSLRIRYTIIRNPWFIRNFEKISF